MAFSGADIAAISLCLGHYISLLRELSFIQRHRRSSRFLPRRMHSSTLHGFYFNYLIESHIRAYAPDGRVDDEPAYCWEKSIWIEVLLSSLTKKGHILIIFILNF